MKEASSQTELMLQSKIREAKKRKLERLINNTKFVLPKLGKPPGVKFDMRSRFESAQKLIEISH